jgi:hypothetical protein
VLSSLATVIVGSSRATSTTAQLAACETVDHRSLLTSEKEFPKHCYRSKWLEAVAVLVFVIVTLPDEPFAPEVMARLIRMTGRRLPVADKASQLLTQIERVLEVNQLHIVSTEVVEAARDSLVIGQS